MGKIIGIDQGSTNSCVSVLKAASLASLKMLRVAVRHRLSSPTPTTMKFRSVCQAAGGHNPTNTLFAVKRLIGRRFEDDVVQKDIKMVPYQIVKADSGDAWQANDDKMAPPQVSAGSCAR